MMTDSHRIKVEVYRKIIVELLNRTVQINLFQTIKDL